jgi:hypothetical protein
MDKDTLLRQYCQLHHDILILLFGEKQTYERKR